jgi:hypothetical protein
MPAEVLVTVLDGNPTEDELRAVLEAVRRYVEISAKSSGSCAGSSRWMRAARLEAQGLRMTQRGLVRGWGS